MDTIFLWPPLLWAARIVLLMALGVFGVGLVVFIVRVLHPRNLWTLLTGHVPAIFPPDGRFAAMELGGVVTIRYVPDAAMPDDHIENGRPRRPQPN